MISVYHRNPDGSEMLIENYYLSPPAYEAAAAEAGLRDFHWPPLADSQEGIGAFPPGYWEDFFQTLQVIGVEAWKYSRTFNPQTLPIVRVISNIRFSRL